MKLTPAACLLVAAPALVGCLEHEETITVRPDGSLAVELSTKGDRADLCTGYAVPLASPWTPRNAGARSWLDTVAPDTGGPRARAASDRLHAEQGEETLVVGAEFASAAELPRWFAPDEEPYRSAYLARSTDLALERKGTRTVYSFERVYHARSHAPWDVTERTRKELRPDLMQQIETDFVFTDDQWPEVASVLEQSFVEAGGAFVRTALASIFTEGDASLPPSVVRAALDKADVTLRAIASRHALDRLHELARELDDARRSGGDTESLGKRLGEQLSSLEREGRRAIRAAIESSLVEAGADPRIRNAVLARLEWAFTSYDHTGDLADETFTLRVRMPGVVVDGNFDELDGEVAIWRFEGKDLQDADRSLTAVSVL